jgi:hypothetical protein
MIPADITEKLITALALWDGRGPSEDETFEAGRALAEAVMSTLVWDAQQ